MKIKEKVFKRHFSKFDKKKSIKDFNDLKINNETNKIKTLNEKLHENITCFWQKYIGTWDFKPT